MTRRGWRACAHAWGPEHGLRCPSGEKYGVLQVCVRCRARRTRFCDGGGVKTDPPVPRDRPGDHRRSGRDPEVREKAGATR